MPMAKDLFITLNIDGTGKAIGLECLTLGQMAIAKITYLEEDPAQSIENAPHIPTGALRGHKSLQQAIKDEVTALRNKTTL
jgi:hypothetical protein